jgi:hypothetical protein
MRYWPGSWRRLAPPARVWPMPACSPARMLQVHHVFARRFPELLDEVLAVRQQPAPDHEEVQHPRERVGHAHRRHLEQAHRPQGLHQCAGQRRLRRRCAGRPLRDECLAPLLEHAVHTTRFVLVPMSVHVPPRMARYDNGQHAAATATPGACGTTKSTHRQEHRHHRRVVEHRRDAGRHRQAPGAPGLADLRARPAQDPCRRRVFRAPVSRSAAATANKRGHRQQPFVGENPAEDLLRGSRMPARADQPPRPPTGSRPVGPARFTNA